MSEVRTFLEVRIANMVHLIYKKDNQLASKVLDRNNFEISVLIEYTFKILLGLCWIKKLRSDIDVGNSWKYNQLRLNFSVEHIH